MLLQMLWVYLIQKVDRSGSSRNCAVILHQPICILLRVQVFALCGAILRTKRTLAVMYVLIVLELHMKSVDKARSALSKCAKMRTRVVKRRY